MGEGAWLIGFIAAQRICELAYVRRNTARLLAAGAVEFGRAHYPFMVVFHAAWLIGLFALGRDNQIDRLLLSVIVLLQIGRLWVLMTLKGRWTTRIVILRNAPLIAAGPYRFMHHPNYMIVVLEIAAIPLAIGLPVFAVAALLVNAVLIWHRIRVENAALAWGVSGENGKRASRQ
jgi:methyltransferase